MEKGITGFTSIYLKVSVYHLSPNQLFTALFRYTLYLSRKCNFLEKLDILKLTAETEQVSTSRRARQWHAGQDQDWIHKVWHLIHLLQV